MSEKAASLREIKQIITDALKKMEEKGGVDRVYCVACGGSYACFYPMEYFLKNEAKEISVASVTANEFYHKTPKGVGERTLVFAMSLGGGTKETVDAAVRAKELGATVIALSGSHESKLAAAADFDVLYKIDIDMPMKEQNQYMALALAVELLNQTEGYVHY